MSMVAAYVDSRWEKRLRSAQMERQIEAEPDLSSHNLPHFKAPSWLRWMFVSLLTVLLLPIWTLMVLGCAYGVYFFEVITNTASHLVEIVMPSKAKRKETRNFSEVRTRHGVLRQQEKQ